MPAAVVNSEDTQKSAADVSKKESTGTVSDENADNKDTQQDALLAGTVTLQILISGSTEPISATFSLQDNVQDVRQVVLDRPESCYKTCFSLQLDGARLDDFAGLHTVEGIKNETNIKIVEEPYTVREARIHVRRLKDLLSTNLQNDAYSAVDNLSLSFLGTVAEVDVEGSHYMVRVKSSNSASSTTTVSTEDCLPPAHVFASDEVPLLSPLFPQNAEPKIPECVKEISPSAWNPPPGYRKLNGDLLYLDIVTLEDVHVTVTASTSGFFINRTHDNIFNPQPHSEACRSHSLVGLLNQLSPSFRKNFAILQKTSIKRHPLEVIPTPYQVFPWAIPKTDHTADTMRAEDAAAVRLSYEEHMPGQLRDWNEELQSARELPRDNMRERLLRDRAIFKINSDFVAAATRGAVAIVDGNVLAINPGEDEKKRLFIWNNIFFSFAFDSRDHYQQLGGDDAAYAAAGGDLRGLVAHNKLDIKGLFTLGTVVVDYRGYRVICQSIIPGILQREQEQSVVYGSIDAGKTVSGHEKFFELLSKAGKALRIRNHKVLTSDDKEVELCSSFECKGIIGADGRHYVLDLFRTFPPDANFVEDENAKDEGGTRDDVVAKAFKHKLCCLRPELLEGFIAYRYVLFLKFVAMHVSTKQHKPQNDNNEETVEQEKSEDKKQDNIETTAGATAQNKRDSSPDASAEAPKDDPAPPVDPDVSAEAIKIAAKAVNSISETEFDVRFNPDVFAPGVKHAPSEERALAVDKALVQDASAFLAKTVVARLVEDFVSLTQTPLDGFQLTEIMHNRGINMRYLGKLASMLAVREDLEHVYRISVGEMIVRAAKQIFKVHLQNASLKTLSVAVSHFLNCFLGSFPSPQPVLPVDEVISRKKKNKRRPLKNGGTGASVDPWACLSPDELWKAIVKDVENAFGFQLDCNSCDDVVAKFHIQKISLLRTFCLKNGVQVLIREYDFDNKKHPTFREDDIMNLFPVVKHTNPKAFDAAAVFEAAQSRLQAGFIGEAYELMAESLNLFHQVYGPLHVDIATCYRAIARLHYLADNPAQAVSYQKMGVIVCERVLGVDHPDTVISYVHLALYCHNAGQASVALKLMYRARYLAVLVFGEGHPDISTFDSNIGLILHGQREFKLAVKFLEKALEVQLKYHGPESVHTAMSFHLVARAKACLSDYRAALQNEKSAYSVYKSKFGEKDPRTVESGDYLKHCTQLAVAMQKKLNEISGQNGASRNEAGQKKLNLEVENFQQDQQNISQLMGLITGLQDARHTSHSGSATKEAESTT